MLKAEMGSPPATSYSVPSPPSESDSLVNTRQPDLLGVTQIAALRASSRALARFDAETFQRRVNCYIVTFV